MQTLLNIFHRVIAEFLEPSFSYLIKSGLNPYFIFLLLVIFIFGLYFLYFGIFFCRGNFSLVLKAFKKMPRKNKRNWFIFLFGGILIAFILFYQMLDLFYKSEDVVKYHSSIVDNSLISFGDKMVLFLEKIGIVK